MFRRTFVYQPMRYTITLLLLAAGFTTLAADTQRSLPTFFLPNAGQTDSAIRYIAQTRGMTVGFAVDSAIFRIQKTEIRVHFSGADPSVAIQGLDAMAARADFLIGDDPAAWHTGVPMYQGTVYRNLYRGIDMKYVADEPRIKSEFLLAPEPIRTRFGWNIRMGIAYRSMRTETWSSRRGPPSCANKRPWHTRNRGVAGGP